MAKLGCQSTFLIKDYTVLQGGSYFLHNLQSQVLLSLLSSSCKICTYVSSSHVCYLQNRELQQQFSSLVLQQGSLRLPEDPLSSLPRREEDILITVHVREEWAGSPCTSDTTLHLTSCQAKASGESWWLPPSSAEKHPAVAVTAIPCLALWKLTAFCSAHTNRVLLSV